MLRVCDATALVVVIETFLQLPKPSESLQPMWDLKGSEEALTWNDVPSWWALDKLSYPFLWWSLDDKVDTIKIEIFASAACLKMLTYFGV